MAAKLTPAQRIYAAAKATAADSLGGARAYSIAGPAIRRLAVAAAIFDLVALQDESVVSDARVRELTSELHLLMVEDGATDWA